MLEVCVESVESALIAKRAGADRIELCGNLIIGGTTPSPKLFEEIRKNSDIRIHAIIRPRFGDFCYSDYEYRIMKEEIKMFRQLGAEGVVIGTLNPDGSLNMEQLKGLIEERGDMSVTLHRAFDVCKDPFEAMEKAIELGINAILTSGQQDSCLEGIEILKELNEKADSRIDIMACGGVCAEVIEKLWPATGITSFHMSGKKTVDSRMTYRKENVHMGIKGISEYELTMTDEKKIVDTVRVLNGFK